MKKKEKIIDIISYILIFGLFAYFAIFQGTYEYEDSFQYLHQYPMREPVYSLLLQFFQIVAKENYNVILGFFQNVLAIICTCWTYNRMNKIFKMNCVFRLGALFALLAPHILTPLASRTHLILTNSVLTEGITVSIYYVWFSVLLGVLCDFYDDKSVRANLLCIGLALVLAMTRGQMAVCLILWLMVSLYKLFVQKNTKNGLKYLGKRSILYVLIIALVFLAKSQITKVYNLLETGNYVDTISSKPMLMANIVYVCDESDGSFIEDQEIREAFKTIVANAKTDGYSVSYASGNVIDRALYHERCHDVLNFEYVDPEIRKVIYRQGIDEEQFLLLMIEEDRICGEMAKDLLPHILNKYISNYFIIISLGFVRSVATEKMGLSVLALLVYVLAFVLCIYGLVKKKATMQCMAMILVFISICGTVCGTSLMIQCMGRYMIYNMAFFYIVGMALVQELFIKTSNE